jgi:hypothetical protein
LDTLDKTYVLGSITLSATGEMTVGFLVLCIPTIPKLLRSKPILSPTFSWFKNLPTETPSSSIGLPSWKKAGARGPKHDTGFFILEEPAPTRALKFLSKEGKVQGVFLTSGNIPEFAKF